MLNVAEMSGDVAHVKRIPVADERDTDNAWLEHDIWAVFLGSRVPEKYSSGRLKWHRYDDIPFLRDQQYIDEALEFFSNIQ